MNQLRRYLLGTLSLALLAGGCAKRVEKSEKAVEHEKWIASLDDSIKTLQQEASMAELALDEATDRVGIMLSGFDYVSNPREVEGYTILKGWRSRYPLTSTGLVARITEGENIELVAALSSGYFSSISVSCDGGSAQSSVVPHDQALNYRSAGLNTVAFQGAQADSVASFIATHEIDNIRLAFLQGGKTSCTITLPQANARMIAETWRLYSSRKRVEELEKTLPAINGKIAAMRRMKDGNMKALAPQQPVDSAPQDL